MLRFRGSLLFIIANILTVIPLALPWCLWSSCYQFDTIDNGSFVELKIGQCRFQTETLERGCPLPHDMRLLKPRHLSISLNELGMQDTPNNVLCEFTYLIQVFLRNNRLTDFSFSPNDCFLNTEVIDLEHNKLTQMDITDYLLLPLLRELILDNNNIKSLWARSIPEETSLQILKIARNNLKTVDVSMVRINSLHFIDLSWNEIGCVTNYMNWTWRNDNGAVYLKRKEMSSRNVLSGYQYKLSVRLWDNMFKNGFHKHHYWGLYVGETRGPQEILKRLIDYKRIFYDFVKIDATGSRQECDCYATNAYKLMKTTLPSSHLQRDLIQLKSSWLNLPCVEAELSGGLIKVKFDDLKCVHKKQCPSGCLCVEYSKDVTMIIDCTGGSLTSIPKILPTSFKINISYDLTLRNNSISQINNVNYATFVKRLDLESNLLTERSSFQNLGYFSNLKQLDLRNNAFRKIPRIILNLTTQLTPSSIRISTDYLICNCDFFEKDQLINLLRIVPRLFETVCRFNNFRFLVHEFRDLHCTTHPPPTLVINNTLVIVRPLDQRNNFTKWMVIGAAIASVVVIIAIGIIIVVVYLRHWCKITHATSVFYVRRSSSMRFDYSQEHTYRERNDPIADIPLLNHSLESTNTFGEDTHTKSATVPPHFPGVCVDYTLDSH